MYVFYSDPKRHVPIWALKPSTIARTTPIFLALYSLVTLIAQECLATGQLPVRAAAWYAKTQPTFSDTLAWVRRWLWSSQNYSMSPDNPIMIKIPWPLFERLTDAVCYASNG